MKAEEKIPKYRTHTCGELTGADAGQKVKLSGWVATRRDHGGVIFIDLRDRWGIVQVTFHPEKYPEAAQAAEKLRSEFVVTVTGTVVARPGNMVNKNISTGEIEIEVSHMEVVSKCGPLPFEIDHDGKVNEELRLQYRYLDLRRPYLQAMLKQRDRFIQHIRSYMGRHDFIEVQTPILTNSSPEGARDYLIPSRIYPGKFYALPQAPQQFKQLLMVAGLDKYFQIAPCFRDEDPRADRHPGEFYQLDMEMSFVEQADVFNMVEPLMIELTSAFSQKEIISAPFPRIPWREAMEKYGSDKPDLRYELHISSVTEVLKETEFKVFAEGLKAKKGVIHALHVPGGGAFTRSEIDELTAKAKAQGAGGLAYIVIKDSKPVSPILKFMGEAEISGILEKTAAQDGDIIFFGAGEWLTVCKTLGAVRVAAAEKRGLRDNTKAAWCWIVDFPMYEWNEEEGKVDFSHNPFSMPQAGLEGLSASDPTEILAYQYDLVLNGYEISSGAIRNHSPEIMYKAFEIAG
ncbi:MAG: aspartate--tRNA ligase, partial [Candidatus Andersenbacteria bacterium]|nr:aspartate--tRNA ligase [Candidatus Andersenbacteria bacterium]